MSTQTQDDLAADLAARLSKMAAAESDLDVENSTTVTEDGTVPSYNTD